MKFTKIYDENHLRNNEIWFRCGEISCFYRLISETLYVTNARLSVVSPIYIHVACNALSSASEMRIEYKRNSGRYVLINLF